MKDYKWLTAALVLYFIIAGSAYWAAQMEVKHRAEMFNDQRVQIAEGEREAAQELAKQYKAEYQAAVFEIAGLKADNEELRSVLDEWNEVAAQVIAAKQKHGCPLGSSALYITAPAMNAPANTRKMRATASRRLALQRLRDAP